MTSIGSSRPPSLASKQIRQKVTKYLLLLNTFMQIFCIPVSLKNIVHTAILLAAFV